MESNEVLTGTHIRIGYESGTYEDFYVTLSLAEANRRYYSVMTGEGTEHGGTPPFMVIEEPDRTSYRSIAAIQDVTLRRAVLADASKTRHRRKPARKPASKSTTTKPSKGATKKA